MKRFTLILSLFCAFVVTALGQETSNPFEGKIVKSIGSKLTSLDDIAQGGWYVLYNNGRNSCVSEETTAFKMRANVQAGDIASDIAGKLFKLTKQDDGNYYIASGNGLYFDFTANNTSSVSETAVAYKIAAIANNTDGYFYIQHATNSWIADGQDPGSNFVCWKTTVPQNTNGNNSYSILPVELSDIIDVTYNYYVDGTLKHTVTLSQYNGADVAAPEYGFVTITNAENLTGKVSSDNKEFNVYCTLNELPFKVTDDIANPVWQVVEMHRYGGNRYWEYDADHGGKVDVVYYTNNKIDVVADNKLWCFVGNALSGFRIYNKAAFADKLTLNATNNNPTIGKATGDNDLWHLASSADVKDPNVACFTYDLSQYMNRNGSGQIAYYGNADNGSTCYFFQPKDIALPAAGDVNTLIANVENVENVPEGAIGILDIKADCVAKFQEKYNKVSADANPGLDYIFTLVNLGKDVLKTVKLPTAGYYFVYGTGMGNQASWRLNYEGTKCYARPLADGEVLDAKHVWLFEQVSDGYKLKSCNLDKYLALAEAPSHSMVESDLGQSHTFTFETDNFGRFIIKNGDGRVMRTENGGEVNWWENNYGNEKNERWYIVPAKKLELTVGEVGYATTHLPFAVTLPENGSLEAYAATNVGTSSVTLTPKDDIPANQGAILKGAGTHKLAIVDAATSDWTDNKLKGTNVATYVEGLSYVLANGTNGVGMYVAALNKTENGSNPAEGETGTHFLNNANKAYLPVQATEENPSRSLVFSFGGEETAIKDINGVENSGKTVIYDLSGRRVQKLGKGLYIVNGKKVVM